MNTQYIDNNFVIFDYLNEENKWLIKSISNLDVKNAQYFNYKAGISIPFEPFVVSVYKSENPEMWTFANKTKVLVIAKYKRFAFESEKNISSLKKSNKEFFISNTTHKKYLYYFEPEDIVVITGNLDIEEMVKVAESLSSTSSEYFPEHSIK